MTRQASARIAGFAYLFYFAIGIGNEVLMTRATRAEGTAATLTRIAVHATDVRLSILLTVLECLAAFVLAVTMYAITSGQNRELAMLGLVCRVVEGMINATGIPRRLQLLWLATAHGAGAPDAATTNAVGTLLLMPGGPYGAIFFAVGNTLFSWLLLRGRKVPAWLAWWGVLSSALLVVSLPIQVAGWFTGPLTGVPWLPVFGYAIVLGVWLLIRGVSDS